jgi:hypothetical protein
MFDKLFNKGTPHERFWNWFIRNREELASIRNGQEPICADMSKQLKKVHSGLAWEFGIEKGMMECIISADGIADVFPAVDALVADAPAIPGWRVTAFRPRKGGDLKVQMGDRVLATDDIYFVATRAGEKLDLELLVDGLTPQNEKGIQHVSFLLMDAVVGEYDVVTRIGGIEFKPLALADGRQRPLSELAAAVDELKG